LIDALSGGSNLATALSLNSCPYLATPYSCYRPHFLRSKRGDNYSDTGGWIKAASAGKLNGAGSKAVTPEEMELSRLRAENAKLKRENEIIKKAAAYFAKDVL
jgi:hypothetical protein